MWYLSDRMVVVLAWCALSAVIYIIGYLATWAHTNDRKSLENLTLDVYPPVSLIKPLKGIEEELEENLESLFRQKYPAEFEIVFASDDPEEPAFQIAGDVAARYPNVPTTFAQSDPAFGLNPKVANMQGALLQTHHDLIFQSDANCRFSDPLYLKTIVAEFEHKRAHVLSSLVVGTGEASWGAAMETVQLTGFIAPATCLVLKTARRVCVIGKSILFKRSDLERVGGMAAVKDLLCEDYHLGMLFQRRQEKAVLSSTCAPNFNAHLPLSRFLRRHLRWAQMRAVISPMSVLSDIASNITAAFGCLSFFLSLRPWVALLALYALKLWLDNVLVKRVRGFRAAWASIALVPLKDVLMLALAVIAVFYKRVSWRGHHFILGARSRLIATVPKKADGLA